MAVQIWSRAGEFLGALQAQCTWNLETFLSEAGTLEVSAPYAEWRAVFARPMADVQHGRVEVTGPRGERLLRGVWLERGDDELQPGVMTVAGSDLLEELRMPALPPEYYLTHHPALSALAAILRYADTDWVLGDVALANDAEVSVDLGGMSCLEAIIEICQESGNHFRHDGWERLLDVFSEPFAVAAYLVCAEPDDELLAAAVGLVEELKPHCNAGEILKAVWPEGAHYRAGDDRDEVLRPQGTEDLPTGFSFQSIGGFLAVRNDAVGYGLVRAADFSRIEALSNVDVSASGEAEGGGAGSIVCEALRRPDDGFWAGGIVELAGQEYAVTSHSGATITGAWPAQPAGAPFTVRKVFEEDAGALDDARQSLVNAACSLLLEQSAAAHEIEVRVSGLAGGLVQPGDRVFLQAVGHVKLWDEMTGEREEHTWTGTHGEMVVSSVGMELEAGRLIHTFTLADRLVVPPTKAGLREMRSLSPDGRVAAPARSRGRGFVVNVLAADPACAGGGHVNTLTFPAAYARPPQVLEAVAMDGDYSVQSAVANESGVTVCVTCSVAFVSCAVLVTIREP